MANTQTFDPAKAGFRVASGPITRKPRTPSSKPVPRPQYANAVWWSFGHGEPLEVTVVTRAVEDTVRALKRAARYLERTESTQSKKVEVRVQISVEPVLGEDGQPVKPAKSVVKFLGHEPFLLGRRISKVEADAREAGREAGEQAAADVIDAGKARHRRTTAGTRPTAKASLPRAVVRAVITRRSPCFPEGTGSRGFVVFPCSARHGNQEFRCDCYHTVHAVRSPYPLQKRWGVSTEISGVGSVGYGRVQGVHRRRG
jgi:hypothetical protein